MNKKNNEVKSIWNIRGIAMGRSERRIQIALEDLSALVFEGLINNKNENNVTEIWNENFKSGEEIEELTIYNGYKLSNDSEINDVSELNNDKVYMAKFNHDNKSVLVINPTYDKVNEILNQIEEIVK
jgi:Fe2+ or Zn2+ uptake regulation protein